MEYMDYYDCTFAERNIGHCQNEYHLERVKVSLTDFICAMVMDKVEHSSNPSSILTRQYLDSSKYSPIFITKSKNLYEQHSLSCGSDKLYYLSVTLLRYINLDTNNQNIPK